jgi:hypothetical protein
LPLEAKTDALSTEILALDLDEGTAVEWKTEKTKS